MFLGIRYYIKTQFVLVLLLIPTVFCQNYFILIHSCFTKSFVSNSKQAGYIIFELSRLNNVDNSLYNSSVILSLTIYYCYRLFFKAEPDLMPKYAFYTDEWNKIAYCDYTGSYPDQPANTWFIVLREIFYVTEETLCVPKMYIQVSVLYL